ncbi:MAG: hypothetical protein ACTSX0_05795 [Promethearchaeota archaeon]
MKIKNEFHRCNWNNNRKRCFYSRRLDRNQIYYPVYSPLIINDPQYFVHRDLRNHYSIEVNVVPGKYWFQGFVKIKVEKKGELKIKLTGFSILSFNEDTFCILPACGRQGFNVQG